MTALERAWSDFLIKLCTEKPSAYVQIRKMFNGESLDVDFDTFNTGISLSASTVAYASWTSKFGQLDRNYFNTDEFTKFREKFIGRIGKEQTCLTARFGNQEKKKESMGFCMQTISFNFLRKPTGGTPKFVIEVYYRSTETGQKFLADLKYLQERLIPFLLEGVPIKPDLIRFRFCTLYMSSMFLPILFQVRDPVEVVKAIQEHDPHWYDRTVSQALGRWLQDENPYNWQTQAKQWVNFDKNVRPNLTPQQLRSLKRLSRANK